MIFNIVCIVGAVMTISSAIVFLIAFLSRNNPLPYTPEEDANQIKYIDDWHKNHKK